MPIEPQTVEAPLSQSAIFLTVDIAEVDGAVERVRDVIADIGGLVRTVGFRDLPAMLSCIVGIGESAWDAFGAPGTPRLLHDFTPVRGAKHAAAATQTDLLFHIRSERVDFCFEFERLLLQKLGADAVVRDEVSGFRYFDSRDLLGFVDGTENPTGSDLPLFTLIGDEDPEFVGGSYVVVQKYLHDLDAWAALSTAQQEAIIGRTKADNVELDDAGRLSHKSLATIEDADGTEHGILRDNMPFGRPGEGEFGTYFIGYAADITVIENMLARMFVGVPAGDYDRILDFSRAVTGGNYFVPSRVVLESLAS